MFRQDRHSAAVSRALSPAVAAAVLPDAARARLEACLPTLIRDSRDSGLGEGQTRDLLEALAVAVYVTDATGRITFYNNAARLLWGWSPPLGDQFWCGSRRLFWPDGTVLPHAECPMARCLSEGRPIRGTWGYAERPDGTRVAFAPFPNPLHDEAGQVVGAVNVLVDISGLIAAERAQDASEAKLLHLAHNDALTGLPTRHSFEASVAAALADTTARLTLLCLDIDQFGKVNDTLGDRAADSLLRCVAARLRDCLGEGETIARLCGDRFAILQMTPAGLSQREEAVALARRIAEALAVPFDFDGYRATVGASIGIAQATDRQPDAVERLLRDAGLALTRARAVGPGGYQVFAAAMAQDLADELTLEADLRDALRRGELVLHYQPIFRFEAAGAHRLVGFEALLRWPHPTRGMVPPAEFIRLAESSGLIVPLGEWALREACAEAATWPEALRVAVNVSPLQVVGTDLAAVVRGALAASGLPASRLELEITESMLLRRDAGVLARLQALRGLGLRLALDDFGTGYCTLTYLCSFPVDKIKIDQSFVRDAVTRPDCLAIVESVAGLARKLGIIATAEGVETMAQLEAARAAGCAEIQGYHLGRPLPAAALPGLFAAG